jgi:hypothetical protein
MWQMMRLTADRVLRSIKAAGYATFEADTPYDLNVFGVRSSDTTPNTFNDLVGIAYRCDAGHWHCETWQATTDPGTYWLEHPGNVNGTAILVPGQYRGVYAVDYHNGQYLALCQRNGPVKVWRDNDKDGALDEGGTVYTDAAGINIHHASSSGTSTQVNKWSAGCQVIADITDWQRFMWLVNQQQVFHPTWKSYTYTLLTEAQLVR